MDSKPEISDTRIRLGEILFKILNEKNKNIIEKLIYSGADFTIKKYQVLKFLVKNDYFDVLKFLFENNIEINASDNEYIDILTKSIKYNKLHISNFFLFLKKNNKYIFDISNGNAFLLSIEKGEIDLVKNFVQRGININVCNDNEENFLEICVKNEKYHISDYLLNLENEHNEKIFDINSNSYLLLNSLIMNNNIEGIKYLLKNNLNVNINKIGDYSSLNIALMNKKFDIAKLLIMGQPKDSKIKCNVNADNGYALFDCVKRNDIELLKILIEYDVDIKFNNLKAVEIAAKKGFLEILNILLDKLLV